MSEPKPQLPAAEKVVELVEMPLKVKEVSDHPQVGHPPPMHATVTFTYKPLDGKVPWVTLPPMFVS